MESPSLHSVLDIHERAWEASSPSLHNRPLHVIHTSSLRANPSSRKNSKVASQLPTRPHIAISGSHHAAFTRDHTSSTQLTHDIHSPHITFSPQSARIQPFSLRKGAQSTHSSMIRGHTSRASRDDIDLMQLQRHQQLNTMMSELASPVELGNLAAESMAALRSANSKRRGLFQMAQEGSCSVRGSRIRHSRSVKSAARGTGNENDSDTEDEWAAKQKDEPVGMHRESIVAGGVLGGNQIGAAAANRKKMDVYVKLRLLPADIAVQTAVVENAGTDFVFKPASTFELTYEGLFQTLQKQRQQQSHHHHTASMPANLNLAALRADFTRNKSDSNKDSGLSALSATDNAIAKAPLLGCKDADQMVHQPLSIITELMAENNSTNHASETELTSIMPPQPALLNTKIITVQPAAIGHHSKNQIVPEPLSSSNAFPSSSNPCHSTSTSFSTLAAPTHRHSASVPPAITSSSASISVSTHPNSFDSTCSATSAAHSQQALLAHRNTTLSAADIKVDPASTANSATTPNNPTTVTWNDGSGSQQQLTSSQRKGLDSQVGLGSLTASARLPLQRRASNPVHIYPSLEVQAYARMDKSQGGDRLIGTNIVDLVPIMQTPYEPISVHAHLEGGAKQDDTGDVRLTIEYRPDATTPGNVVPLFAPGVFKVEVRGCSHLTDVDTAGKEDRNLVFKALLIILMYVASGIVFYSQMEGWTFLEALYFCLVTMATTGFGDLQPTTNGSKIFTIFYILIGVALIATALGLVGGYVLEKQENALMKAVEKNREKKAGMNVQLRKVLITGSMLIAMMAIGIIGFAFTEDLDFVDAWYLTIITMSTIGYGGSAAPKTTGGRVFCCPFLVFSAILLTKVVGDLADIYLTHRQEKISRRILKAAVTSVEDIASLDDDNSGEVTELEFLKHMLVKMGACKQRDIDDVCAHFKVLDKDGSGTLDAADFRRNSVPSVEAPKT